MRPWLHVCIVYLLYEKCKSAIEKEITRGGVTIERNGIGCIYALFPNILMQDYSHGNS